PGEEDHPIVFTLNIEGGNFVHEGDAVFHEDKLITTFVALGQLEALKYQMRPSTYRRTYGIMEDSLNNIKDLLTQMTESGRPYTEAMKEVRNEMHTAFYTQRVLLRQRITMDTKPGMKRANTVSAMMDQLDHMFSDYGFDDVRSGAPLYAIYGGYIADTISEMRIPDMMNKVPANLKSIDNNLSELFSLAESLRVREGLSDANLKTGTIVDDLLEQYIKKTQPAIEASIAKGMEWNGYDKKLREYVESVKGIREVDVQENVNVGNPDAPIPLDTFAPMAKPGKMPLPKL
ncbi:MAG: hypothetical protein KDD40_09100, partial [Bdellovibrionales bacterium]|nr:hypothetical protein [Bdellovibrionales bacterium]